MSSCGVLPTQGRAAVGTPFFVFSAAAATAKERRVSLMPAGGLGLIAVCKKLQVVSAQKSPRVRKKSQRPKGDTHAHTSGAEAVGCSTQFVTFFNSL